MRKLLFISIFCLAAGLASNAQTNRSSISLNDAPKVRLFPNPATTSLQVEWNDQLKPASMLIVNGITGKQMVSTAINNGPLRINVSNYIPGIYVFRMFSATGTYLGGATFQVSK